MTKKQLGFVGYLLLGIMAMLVLSVALSARPQAAATTHSQGLPPVASQPISPTTEDFPQAFAARLLKMGVPLKSIQPIAASPSDIEINIQANFGASNHDDVWYSVLATREVKYAYVNFGVQLRNVTVKLLDAENKVINGNDYFLNSANTPQFKNPYPPALLDDQTAGRKLLEFIDTKGLDVVSQEVPANFSSLYASRAVILNFSIPTTDKTVISDRMEALATDIVTQVRDFNATFQSHFWLLWVKVTDAEGNLVLEMAADTDGDSIVWHPDYVEFKSWPRPAFSSDANGNPLVTMAPQILPTPTPVPTLPDLPPNPTGLVITVTPIPPYP